MPRHQSMDGRGENRPFAAYDVINAVRKLSHRWKRWI